MKRSFILDKEIDLLEKGTNSSSNDLLNTSIYAETLKKAILKAPSDSGFTIGLFGEWGSGKSSIIKTVEAALTKEEALIGKKVKIITYDAWKYANDSFRRMFLLKMQKDLNFNKSEFMELFYNNKSEETKIKLQINKQRLSILLGILTLIILAIYAIQSIPSDFKNVLYLFSLIIGFLSQLFKKTKVFDELKVSIQSPLLFAPEQFEKCFDEMVEKSMKKYNWVQTGLAFFKGETHEKNIDQLIIVIDNIDRCHKELAYELLTNIKNFLGDDHSIIFVIPVDDKALKRHIRNNEKSDVDCDRESDEFLRKFFNVTIRIKPFGTEEMFDFSEQLIKKYNLGFDPTTISLVSNEFATNPRRIIQIFNNLSTELECVSSEIAHKHQATICKLLIIREEYQDYYKKLTKQPEILFEKPEIKEGKDKGLNIFLNNTYAITSSLKGNIEIIESILSNSNVFNEISQTIKGLIKRSEMDRLVDYIKSNIDSKDKIVNYIFSLLRKSVKRKLFSTDVRNQLLILLELSKNNILNQYEIRELYDIIKDENDLQETIKSFDNYDNLILFAAELDKINLHELSEFIVNVLKSAAGNTSEDLIFEDKGKDAISFACFHLELRFVQMLDSAFFKTYKNKSEILREFDYAGKYELLCSYNLLEYIIQNLSLVENDKYMNDFNFILSKIKLNDKLFNLFILHANQSFPEYEDGIQSIEIVNDLFSKINTTLELAKDIDYLEDLTAIETLFNKLNEGVVLTRVGAQKSTKGYFYDVIENEESAQILIDFCFLVFKLSKGNIFITPSLNILLGLNENRIYVNEKILNLLDHGFPLTRLYQIILDDENYSDTSFKLLKHVFLFKQDSEYVISEADLKLKLTQIIKNIFSDFENKREQLVLFLEDNISDERISHNISILLSLEPKAHILMLSTKLQALSINSFASKIEQYEDTINVLKLIASLGSKSHISKVVKIINKKLNSSSSFDSALEIILELKEINKKDAAALISNIESNEKEGTEDKSKSAKLHINKIH